MQSFVIVPRVDERDQGALTGRMGRKVRAVQQFPVERGKETFRDRVVPTIPAPARARDAVRVRVRDRPAVLVTRVWGGLPWSE